MIRVQVNLLLLSCFCAAGALCVTAQDKPNATTRTPGPPSQVQVVNTTAQPVPTAAQGTTTVAGTVSIGNSPTVSIGNTPSVNLAAGASVNVTSPLDSQSNPKPLAVFDAFQTWEDACSLHFQGASSGSCTFRSVPGGKRLVIQEVDTSVSLETSLWLIGMSIFPYQVPHAVVPVLIGSGSGMSWYQSYQETHLYAPANASPSCVVVLSGASANGAFSCQLTGFLIDTQ